MALQNLDLVRSRSNQPVRLHTNIAAARFAALGGQRQILDVIDAGSLGQYLQNLGLVNVAPERPAGAIRSAGQRIQEVIQSVENGLLEARLVLTLARLHGGAYG